MVTSILGILILLGMANLLASLFALIVRRPIGSKPQLASTACPQPSSTEPASFVSVHVAVHDEPADLVIATLDALARSVYPAFEVIVIDNNTPAVETWQPVAQHCTSLGGRFRFCHCDGVEGAKAGALNIALGMSDPRATYIAVVDADYCVTPDFIAAAVACCSDDVQFVQFPQAYRSAAGASVVVNELSDYFELFPRAANRDRASLLTGTLSLISIDALRRVGGWPMQSITEDAELGLLLWSAGARGLYIDREVGYGLLPVDLAGLRLQRQRWVTGNVQTLIAGRRALFEAPSGTSAVLAQLTAWVGLLAIPLVTLAAIALARAVPKLESEAPAGMWRFAEAISVAAFLCALVGHLTLAVRRDRIASIAVTAALLWTSSFAWLSAFGFERPTFRRTPKAISRTSPGMSVDTVGGIAALLIACVFLLDGSLFTAGILMLSAAGLATAPIVDRSLRRAAAGI